MKTFADKYDDEYFEDRLQNNKKRVGSFLQEKALLLRHMSLSGAVCDVGCSTGEFLEIIQWRGQRFGMEVNEAAIEAARTSGVSFEKSILTEENFFDAVVFRGTIQHLPDPFLYIGASYRALKPGGIIAFLATPNANSVVYKLFNTLPALVPELNFYIPSDITLRDILRNYNFRVIDIEYPYLSSPYANPIIDHFDFAKSLIMGRKPSFAFWKNMMNVIARKQ